jgi:hypothetical protein
MSSGWWELIFLMFLMKIPIVYLCAVVWWAVKAEPRPEEGAALLAEVEPEPPPRFFGRYRSRPRRPRNGPHGSPVRRPHPRVAATRAEVPKPKP